MGQRPAVRSMTGFGRAEKEHGGRVLAAEAKSVNHRFLELSMRLPRSMQAEESLVRSTVQERLERGKVNLTVAWNDEGESEVPAWNEALAERYHTLLNEVRSRFGFREPITLSHLLANPELFTFREPVLGEEEARGLLRDVVSRALVDLVAMREREGEALAADLEQRLDHSRRLLQAIRERSPERARETKEKLERRMQELLGETPVDQDRLLNEAAGWADRMDCTEECVRLASHIDQFGELLAGGGGVGRKLNFLAQEMNREANTIGSKSNDVTVSRQVIQLNEEVEILREQIQNLE